MESLIEKLYDLFLAYPEACIDSRKVVPGCMFFGLEGDQVDGSLFGESAIANGASCAVVRHGTCAGIDGVFSVNNPLEVLQQLAAHHRRQLKIPVVGITGSNGKTTTKELISRVLAMQYAVTSTLGNLNNHIGVPLTLLSIRPTDEIAIVEMGANHEGEIRNLCKLAIPTHGLVTNIGKAHLEGFGGLEGVKRAKSELYDSLRDSGGVAFVNFNESYLTELSADVVNRLWYGFANSIGFHRMRYEFVARHSANHSDVNFVDPNGREWNASSTLFGEFNLANIATAIAVGLHFEVSGDQICHAIASYRPDNNRAQRLTFGDRMFILDAYNANPTSMLLSIKSFSSIEHPHKFMIIGAMMEMGEYSESEHFEVAKVACKVGDCDAIFVGDQFRQAAAQFGRPWYADVDAFKTDFESLLPVNAVILIKGSRAMRLESLLSGFQ